MSQSLTGSGWLILKQRSEQGRQGFPWLWAPSENWDCTRSCLILLSTLWMPCSKYLGESREVPVMWGREVVELWECNCEV